MLLLITGCQCGDGALGPVDAGAVGLGAVDAGHLDAGGVDAGTADAGGAVDAGPVDAGAMDAGPTDAGAASTRIDLSLGSAHTCALSNGTVRCWGSNNSGQLGDGTNTWRSSPTTVAALPAGVSAVAAGAFHTCAVIVDGGLQCWGRNSDGELGLGPLPGSALPSSVVGLDGGVVRSVAGGNGHTCALLSTGTVKCWGNNIFGQLGDGTTTSRRTPVDVPGLSNVAAVHAGNLFTCALGESGWVKCWGHNPYGQLGDGTTTNRSSPVTVVGLPMASALDLGGQHACALTLGGQVMCWGNNLYGGLGLGSVGGTSAVPVGVAGLDAGVTAIAGGSMHGCALTAAGPMCWGHNSFGQTGDGTNNNSRYAPVAVAGLAAATALWAGGDVSCANTPSGVMCWGYNGAFQLGTMTGTWNSTPTLVRGL